VPIIALTANALFGMKEMFLQNGMNDFVPKPIDPARIYDVLANWVPKEKHSFFDSQAATPIPSKSETFSIPGINTRLGIMQAGGTLEGYLRVIRTLCDELDEKTKAMEEALDTDDLATYGRHAHSYRGFLATIGAMSASATAAMLETAAQNGDRVTMGFHHGNFVLELQEIAASVAAALKAEDEKRESENISTEDEDSSWLLMELTRLKAAVGKMDITQIDAIMDDLLEKHWTKAVKEQLEKVMQSIMLYEWSEAVALIEELREGRKPPQ